MATTSIWSVKGWLGKVVIYVENPDKTMNPGIAKLQGHAELDEISMSAATTVCEIRDGWFRTFVLTPEEFGFERCSKEDLKGGTPKENAEITLAILKGEKGPKRNAVLLNAGAALYIGEKADSIKAGIALAEELIDSGKALDTLQKLIEGSNRGEGCV